MAVQTFYSVVFYLDKKYLYVLVQVLRLLLVAWDRRLIFSVGTSSTTGESDTVIWNEVRTLRLCVASIGWRIFQCCSIVTLIYTDITLMPIPRYTIYNTDSSSSFVKFVFVLQWNVWQSKTCWRKLLKHLLPYQVLSVDIEVHVFVLHNTVNCELVHLLCKKKKKQCWCIPVYTHNLMHMVWMHNFRFKY